MKQLNAILQKNLDLYQPHTVPRRTVQRIIDDIENGGCLECGKPMHDGEFIQQCMSSDHDISFWKTPSLIPNS